MKWSRLAILEILKNYTKISEFKYFNRGAYKALTRLSMLTEVREYYNTKSSTPTTYSYEELLLEAQKYASVVSFKQNSRVYYEYAIKERVLRDICSHMKCLKGFDKSKPGILYYLSIDKGTAYKIGITNSSVEKRFSLEELEHITVLKTWLYESGEDCYNEEQRILREFKEYKYNGEKLLKTGNTELFSINILNI